MAKAKLTDEEDNKVRFDRAKQQLPDPFPGSELDYPWRDSELLEQLYHGERLSIPQIADGWGCGESTLSKWMDKHDVDRRSPPEAAYNMHGTENEVPFRTSKRGYEIWRHLEYEFFVHRLIAVAKFGTDQVAENDVHHINEVPWDNRPGNITVLSHGDHNRHHKEKVRGVERLRVAELYENGEISSRQLAEHIDHEITGCTVLSIHKEAFKNE